MTWGNKSFLGDSDGEGLADTESLGPYLASDGSPVMIWKLKPGELISSTDLLVHPKNYLSFASKCYR